MVLFHFGLKSAIQIELLLGVIRVLVFLDCLNDLVIRLFRMQLVIEMVDQKHILKLLQVHKVLLGSLEVDAINLVMVCI